MNDIDYKDLARKYIDGEFDKQEFLKAIRLELLFREQQEYFNPRPTFGEL